MREARRALPLPVLVSAVAIAALGVAGLVGYRRGRRQPEADRDVDSRALRQAALEQELTELRARLRALEWRAQPAAVAPAASWPAEPEAAPPARPRRAPPATAEDERQYFAALEARRAGEIRDPEWAEPTERRLRQSAEGFGARLTIESARCGRAVCRLDIKREVGPDAPATMEELVRRAVRVLPAALVQNTEDPARLVVYLVREGAEGFPPLVGRDPEPAPPR
jgi:hypothetical protein